MREVFTDEDDEAPVTEEDAPRGRVDVIAVATELVVFLANVRNILNDFDDGRGRGGFLLLAARRFLPLVPTLPNALVVEEETLVDAI